LIILITISQITYSKTEEFSVEIERNSNIREAANLHLPILGDRAETIGNLKVNFDKMPGGQATDSFVMNSISLGLGSRVEIGIIPWVYSGGNESFMKYGATIKYNFYKGREFQWAIGGSQIKGQMEEETNDRDENGYGSKQSFKMDHWWNYQFVSVNYTPIDKRYNLGLTFKYTEIKSTSSVKGSYAYEFENKKIDYPLSLSSTDASYNSTLTFDMNYQLKSYNWVGMAIGTGSLGSRLNIDDSIDEETESNARVRYVLGTSYIYRKKLGFLDTPRLSVLLFEGDGVQFGFSTFL
jgi:hypothetical protein